MNRVKILVGSAAVILLAGAGMWLWYRGFIGGDPKLLRSIQDKPELVALFKNPQIATHADLTRVLEAEPLSEHETKQVLDTLLVYWQDSFKTALEQHDLEKQSQAERMLKLFAYGLDRIPMPGGAKFFWRTLFLFLEKK